MTKLVNARGMTVINEQYSSYQVHVDVDAHGFNDRWACPGFIDSKTVEAEFNDSAGLKVMGSLGMYGSYEFWPEIFFEVDDEFDPVSDRDDHWLETTVTE